MEALMYMTVRGISAEGFATKTTLLAWHALVLLAVTSAAQYHSSSSHVKCVGTQLS